MVLFNIISRGKGMLSFNRLLDLLPTPVTRSGYSHCGIVTRQGRVLDDS